MKNIIKSLLVIVAVAAVAGGATYSYYFDTESSTGNSFIAGELDLVLDEGSPLPFAVSDVVPGQNGDGTVTLTNTAGSIPGALSITWVKTGDDEHDMIEPESQSYPRHAGCTSPGMTTADYAGNGGELDMFLQFAPFVDVNKDGTFNSGDIQLAYNGNSTAYPGYRSGALYYSGLNSYLTTWTDVMTLDGGDSVNVVVPWQFPTESTDCNYSQNMSMTDSLGFDAEFKLDQIP